MVEQLSHITEKAIFLKAKLLILVPQGLKNPFGGEHYFPIGSLHESGI